jgi:hypothetical protein
VVDDCVVGRQVERRPSTCLAVMRWAHLGKSMNGTLAALPLEGGMIFHRVVGNQLHARQLPLVILDESQTSHLPSPHPALSVSRAGFGFAATPANASRGSEAPG